VIDTSVMLAGLVRNHEFHEVARTHVVEAAKHQVPGIVVAETWAALRRGPWYLDATSVQAALLPWASVDRIAATPAGAYVEAVRTGRASNLGGNIHDLLIAMTCAEHGLPLTTLDRRQARLGRGIPGLDVTLLLPDA
jgi:predicted nucleic acid-binding protein